MTSARTLSVASLLVLSTLSGCGDKPASNDLNALDSKLLGANGNAALAGNEADPALMSALEDQIMVDPGLAQQSNDAAARPTDTPGAAPIPVTDVPLPDKGSESISTVDYGGGSKRGDLLPAPAPTKAGAAACTHCDRDDAITLGELSSVQQSGGKSGSCAGKIDYSIEWAKRLPVGLPVFPNARATEAAGANSSQCRIRAVTFVAPAAMDTVIDWYYTKMVRAGFRAEHQLRKGEHILAGVRETDDSAWYIMFNKTAAGGTEIDIIANNGQ
jgi:hypothetical protein